MVKYPLPDQLLKFLMELVRISVDKDMIALGIVFHDTGDGNWRESPGCGGSALADMGNMSHAFQEAML